MKHLLVPAICILALWLTSCATVTQEVVAPDGTKTTTRTVTVDPNAATAIANAAAQAALEHSQGNAEIHREK